MIGRIEINETPTVRLRRHRFRGRRVAGLARGVDNVELQRFGVDDAPAQREQLLFDAQDAEVARRPVPVQARLGNGRPAELVKRRVQVAPGEDLVAVLAVGQVDDAVHELVARTEQPAQADEKVVAAAVAELLAEDAVLFGMGDRRVDVLGENEVGDGQGGLGEAVGEGARGEGHAGAPVLVDVCAEDGVVVDGPAVAVDLGGKVVQGVVLDEGFVGGRDGLGDVLGDAGGSGEGEGAGCVAGLVGGVAAEVKIAVDGFVGGVGGRGGGEGWGGC